MNTKRRLLWTGILLPLLAAGYPLHAQAGQERNSATSPRDGIVRDGLDPRLVPVPVTPCFLDRDETWFRVSRGSRHGW